MRINRSESGRFLNSFLEVLEDTLKAEEPVGLQGFGKFELWKQTERLGRNPRTGVPCIIPARTSVRFKAGKYLLEALNARDTYMPADMNALYNSQK
ncbi:MULTISPECIES: HU family DNA-binding protein [Parabacteroides]|uniref:HU family DNA-binding protein n=1 Tax=Parabacteroides leei TaxID=2939491 RepID=UPI001E5C3670|nr:MULTISPECIES: HU family DNA-binding protein [Parabacteroides]MCL3851100.1 HU family DNA-binding protein [Parabacteroides leei]